MQSGQQRRLTSKNKLVGCVCFCRHEPHGIDRAMWRRSIRRTMKHQDRHAQAGLTTLKFARLYS